MKKIPLCSIPVLVIIMFIVVLTSSCKKEEENTPAVTQPETGTVTDIDGNIYETVKIGDQWWMAENLKVRTYNNGQPLPSIAKNSFDWVDTLPAYCLYDETNDKTGYLYNWYVVSNTLKIAPVGWHIPTDEDWKQLEKSIGMSQDEADRTGWRGSNEADKLKVASPQGWTPYGTIWSTNESGFTALAGSCRLFNFDPGDPGLSATGFWWTSTNHNNDQAWYRYLDYKSSGVFRSHTYKGNGYSIRCVKD